VVFFYKIKPVLLYVSGEKKVLNKVLLQRGSSCRQIQYGSKFRIFYSAPRHSQNSAFFTVRLVIRKIPHFLQCAVPFAKIAFFTVCLVIRKIPHFLQCALSFAKFRIFYSAPRHSQNSAFFTVRLVIRASRKPEEACRIRSPGDDVVITIFGDFRQFSAKKLAFFSKPNVMITIFAKK
jgi:hypothetical protein